MDHNIVISYVVYNIYVKKLINVKQWINRRQLGLKKSYLIADCFSWKRGRGVKLVRFVCKVPCHGPALYIHSFELSVFWIHLENCFEF